MIKKAQNITVGHPVDVSSGTLLGNSVDCTITGRMDLIWERLYSSALLSKPTSILGPGWTASILCELTRDLDGYRFLGPDAGETIFDDIDGIIDHGGTVRVLGSFSELKKLGNKYIVTQWNVETAQLINFVFVQKISNQKWLLKSIEDARGQGLDFSYDAGDRLSTIKQRREGRGFYLRYNEQAQVIGIALSTENFPHTELIIHYDYDQYGRLVAASDALGHTSYYQYNRDNQLVSESRRGGAHFLFSYDNKGRCILASGQDNYDKKILNYFDTENATEVTDSLGNNYRYEWNLNGQVEKTISPLGNVSLTEYDEFGRVIAEIDPNGAKTSYEYDEKGNRCSTTNALGHVTKVTYDHRRFPIQISDAAGGIWKREFDDNRRLVSTQDPLGNLWKYIWDDHGDLIKLIDAQNNKIVFKYAPNGDLAAVSDWNGNYSLHEHDECGRLSKFTDPLGHRYSFSYDAAGNITKARWPDKSQTTIQYNSANQVTELQEAGGPKTRFLYGPCGRLLERIDPKGNSIRYSWGTEPRQLLQISNENLDVCYFEYDSEGRLAKQTSFDGTTSCFTYGEAGQLLQIEDGQCRTTKFERDLLGRLTTKVLHDGSVVRYEYNEFDLVTKAQNDTCSVSFDRDSIGRITRETRDEYFVDSKYEDDGLRSTRTTSLGFTNDYEYDPNGRHSLIRFNGADFVQFVRDQLGREISRNISGKIGMRQKYDSMGQLIEQAVAKLPGAGDESRSQALSPTKPTIIHRKYDYDESGNLTHVNDVRWGHSELAYDLNGQILRVSQKNKIQSFDYDPAGNVISFTDQRTENQLRTSAQIQSVFTESAEYSTGNILRRVGNRIYDSDPEGRIVRKSRYGVERENVCEYHWNADGMLSSILTQEGNEWKYAYDAFGRRVRKEGPGLKVDYVWDGDVVVHELSDSGMRVDWTFLPESFEPFAKDHGDGPCFFITDQVGIPRELVDKSGTIVWSSIFTVWGEIENSTGDLQCPLRFQGQWFDQESGLCYNRFRYFDPSISRFISPEPFMFAGGINQFQYFLAPTGWVDPYGLFPWQNPVRSGHHMVPWQAATNLGVSPFNSRLGVPSYYFSTPYQTSAHEAIQAGTPIRASQVQGMSRREFLQILHRQYSRPEIQHLRGDLHIITAKGRGQLIAKNVSPAEAWIEAMRWMRKQKQQGQCP